MTVQEYIHILTDRYNRQTEITKITNKLSIRLYPLYDEKHRLHGEYLDLQYSLGSSHSDTYSKNKEVEKISKEILEEEKSLGITELNKEYDELEIEIERICDNAEVELTEYEYHSNTIICGTSKQNTFFSENGFRSFSVYVSHDTRAQLYVLKKSFDYENGHIFLENMSPFLKFNAMINGIDCIEIGSFESESDYTIIHYNDVWAIRIESDIVFEHSECKEVLQYYNFIR
ncbi:hypothetical protein SEPL_308 [Salmonella phage SE_PL]|nr:hypothetical protein CPT_Munch_117 [Salmonella phage Munch]EAZ2022910.1 hypothetical protein [Salmonella enterica]ECV9084044.1 hypothetical protein [Salmonella enterica subsp. enterica serovar Infantis]MCP0435854.1 hypothetical protein [Salmonella enterica subsp. enterica serovar Mbandaka]QCW18796.1 hypothetical protein 7t3_0275 [Salmonella phage 7t3]QIG62921.1 hypothetical protein SEPL_308 [Salmonella phage SE_PL]